MSISSSWNVILDIWAPTSIPPFKLKTLDQFRPGCLNLKDEDTLVIFFCQFSRSAHHALLPTTIQKTSWTLESFGISLISFHLLIPCLSYFSSSSLLFLFPAFQYSPVSFLWVSMWQYPRWKTLRVVIYSLIKNVGLSDISQFWNQSSPWLTSLGRNVVLNHCNVKSSWPRLNQPNSHKSAEAAFLFSHNPCPRALYTPHLTHTLCGLE